MNDTPTSLEGNPYVEDVLDAVVFSADDSPMQTTEVLLDEIRHGLLALAFEVRTANLIAAQKTAFDLVANPSFTINDVAEIEADLEILNDQVTTRLGLENDDATH